MNVIMAILLGCFGGIVAMNIVDIVEKLVNKGIDIIDSNLHEEM